MAKKQKLNSMRLLEKHGISYEIIEYDSTIKNAELVAAAIGIDASLVYKTLVLQSVAGEKPFLVMLPSNSQLDLKAMARACGEKKVQMIAHADAEKLTGLQVGGISGLALTHKRWSVFLDQSASTLQEIVISAGQRGVQIKLATEVLQQILQAKMVDVSIPKS